jgi:hypothetical protein
MLPYSALAPVLTRHTTRKLGIRITPRRLSHSWRLSRRLRSVSRATCSRTIRSARLTNTKTAREASKLVEHKLDASRKFQSENSEVSPQHRGNRPYRTVRAGTEAIRKWMSPSASRTISTQNQYTALLNKMGWIIGEPSKRCIKGRLSVTKTAFPTSKAASVAVKKPLNSIPCSSKICRLVHKIRLKPTKKKSSAAAHASSVRATNRRLCARMGRCKGGDSRRARAYSPRKMQRYRLACRICFPTLTSAVAAGDREPP